MCYVFMLLRCIEIVRGCCVGYDSEVWCCVILVIV